MDFRNTAPLRTKQWHVCKTCTLQYHMPPDQGAASLMVTAKPSLKRHQIFNDVWCHRHQSDGKDSTEVERALRSLNPASD